MSDHLRLGFQLMGYGLAGVFTVLMLFMAMIKALTSLFSASADREEDGM